MMIAAVLVEYNNEEVNTIRSCGNPKKTKTKEKNEKEEREKNGSVVRKGGGQQNANN